MKVLFVASRFPYPPFQGDRWRAFHQLQGLANRHEILLISPPPDRDPECAIEAIAPLCAEIVTVPSPAWKRAGRLAKAPLTSLPLQTLYAFEPAVCHAARAAAARFRPDVAHAQLIRTAPVAQALNGVPRVLDLIDALSLNMSRRASRERGVRRRVVALEARRTARYERDVIADFHRVIVSSDVDAAVIGRGEQVSIVPNCVDAETHPFQAGRRDACTVIFTGRMGYHPNVDAALWLAEEIFPVILREAPAARLVIAGADPAPDVLRLARLPGVSVTGRVPSMQERLLSATVAVAPLRSGSGMQLKVLEAMALGTPVVATPFAVGGLRARHGEHLCVAESAEEFAWHVVRLLANPLLALHLSRQARQLIETQYTWTRGVAMLEATYHMAIEIAARAEPALAA